jgi:Na+(H+)/acetate symporter ActP
MNYWILIPILIAQQFSYVLVSRARNSNSIMYGTIGSVASNCTYFVGQILMVDQFMKILRESNMHHAIVLGAIYITTMTLTASASQWICMRWFEKGKNDPR